MSSVRSGVGKKVHGIGAAQISERVWWDPTGFWFGLHTLLDPVRVPYFTAVLSGFSGPRVLDVGSGAGFVAAGIGGKARVVAIDRSEMALRDALAVGISPVAVADATELPFGDETFDAVICSEVLEHVSDPTRVIAEAARVTRPGGLFLFSTPARTPLTRLLLIQAAQRWPVTRLLPRDLHEWDRFLTPSELGELLVPNGFTPRELSGIGVPTRELPRALWALLLLKLRHIGYAEAGRRVTLTTTKSTQIAMIGYAERTG
jgi:2-polyprenyl-6-hydroxyphenyl methylase/3-demethylubiquinone-9 3-methyltransferase